MSMKTQIHTNLIFPYTILWLSLPGILKLLPEYFLWLSLSELWQPATSIMCVIVMNTHLIHLVVITLVGSCLVGSGDRIIPVCLSPLQPGDQTVV